MAWVFSKQHVVCASGQGALLIHGFGERAETPSEDFLGGEIRAVLRENTQAKTATLK